MGSSCPVPVGWGEMDSSLLGPQYPGPLRFKAESLHFPINQNCEEVTPWSRVADCFIAGFSFSSPRTPFLVLEEGVGFI
ncbi:hypothetical protein ACRRTK_007977 [Alexandromys fortis]